MKKLLIISLLTMSASSAFAAQCPLNSDFSHVPGQAWMLNSESTEEGWFTLSDHDSSKLRTFSPSAQLVVTITLKSYNDSMTQCYYKEGSTTVTAINLTEVNLKTIPVPPFYRNLPQYLCYSRAGNPEQCQWSWK